MTGGVSEPPIWSSETAPAAPQPVSPSVARRRRAKDVAAAWAEALDLWGVSVTLSPPQRWKKDAQARKGASEPLAFIDMIRRQVVVNLGLLQRMGAWGSLPAVLAHEIGHHIRFPHTLGLSAALEVLEQRLIPGLGESLTNLFFDLQVNEIVGRTHAEQLCAVYRAFSRDTKGFPAPIYSFYLATYEELWGLKAGSLSSEAACTRLETEYPGNRAEARMFAQTFWALDDVYLQFVYFCSVFQRYIPDPPKHSVKGPLTADVPRPGLDDYAGALYGGAAIERALDEAEARGWIEAGDGEAGAGDALTNIARVVATRPGNAQGEFQRALVGHHYRRLVDEYIFAVPPATEGPAPDAFLPTTVVEWEPGDDVRSIDWTQSVLTSGALAGIRPMRRELLPDEPHGDGTSLPAVEIYLDTSCSMPSPIKAVNAMTLAAQILSAAAIRRGGRVRAIVYSAGPPMVSDWMQDEETARDFLLHYVGGGTEYPFKVLRRFCAERADVTRVIVSDGDFLWNLKEQGAMAALSGAVDRSARVVALLALPHQASDGLTELFAPLTCRDGFRLVPVTSYADLGRAARDLAAALFGGR